MPSAMFSGNSESGAGTLTQDSDPIERAIRELVAKALNGCKKRLTREQIAAELSARMGQRVTKSQLDDWASESKKGLRFPVSLVKPLCQVTGDDRLARIPLTEQMAHDLRVGEFVREHGWVVQTIKAELQRVFQERRDRQKRGHHSDRTPRRAKDLQRR